MLLRTLNIWSNLLDSIQKNSSEQSGRYAFTLAKRSSLDFIHFLAGPDMFLLEQREGVTVEKENIFKKRK